MKDSEEEEGAVDSETEAELYSRIYHHGREELSLHVENEEETTGHRHCSIKSQPLDLLFDTTTLQTDAEEQLGGQQHQQETEIIYKSRTFCNDQPSTSRIPVIDLEEESDYSDIAIVSDELTLNLKKICASKTKDTNFPGSDFDTIEKRLEKLQGDSSEWEICDIDKNSSNTRQTKLFGRYFGTLFCKICKSINHATGSCPVSERNKRKTVCYLCASKKHSGYRCKHKACSLCFQFGHFSSGCKKAMKIARIQCKRCHDYGHKRENCPEHWRQFHSTTELSEATKLKRYNSRSRHNNRRTYCFNCGEEGHFGADCEEFSGNCFPFETDVRKYDSAAFISELTTAHIETLQSPAGFILAERRVCMFAEQFATKKNSRKTRDAALKPLTGRKHFLALSERDLRTGNHSGVTGKETRRIRAKNGVPQNEGTFQKTGGRRKKQRMSGAVKGRVEEILFRKEFSWD